MNYLVIPFPSRSKKRSRHHDKSNGRSHHGHRHYHHKHNGRHHENNGGHQEKDEDHHDNSSDEPVEPVEPVNSEVVIKESDLKKTTFYMGEEEEDHVV